MTPADAKPKLRRAAWLRRVVLLVAATALGATAAAAYVSWQESRRPPPPHPRGPYSEGMENPAGAIESARKHMEELAEAVIEYRAQFGDHTRWPAALEDLKNLRLIRADFEFSGVLSGRPLSWMPQMPPGHEHARWAMCCDVRVGWRFDPRRHGSVRAPLSAVVILGDGSVRVLGAHEMDSVGGLVFEPER